MKFSSHFIYFFIVLFAHVKESNETNANRKYKCHHQSNDRAEFDFKNDDAVTSQYKKYLNAPTKLGPVQFTLHTFVDNQEWFDKFQIDAAIWHFQKLSSELLGEALQILNESNDVEQISGEETPTNAKEAVVEMATEYARIETKCAKMKEGIEDSKRALCYHYNTLATIVEGMDKWTTDKRATSKILGKRRVKKLIKILPVHSTEAKVPS
uniref:Uncharacterized protein n=1 Tax=Globodera rostochiensis TaxID=31243 RepID=A0A914HXW4_GLORO